MLGIFYHSPLYSLETRPLSEPRAGHFLLSWRPAVKPSDPAVSLVPGLHMHAVMPGFACMCWDLNTSPYVCTSSPPKDFFTSTLP